MKDNFCCCVCLKEEPFENNPIITCENCSTTVHRTCYGIQQIPDGAWFCQKCISQERTARVRCELCPFKGGALKHTNKGGWCHIICALFIQGAEFFDSEQLETISIDKVPCDKINKICTICEKNNRLDLANAGACIQCWKSGCKVLFHVICAQSQGLLTEIASSKGMRYVAYCVTHKQKTKHRDFTIRVSSSHQSIRYNKNKQLRQTPPKLEKSNEGCITPQEISVESEKSVPNKNISYSSGDFIFSSDSRRFDDPIDRQAPIICADPRIIEFSNKIVSRSNCADDFNRSIEPLPAKVYMSYPPNLCISDTLDSFNEIKIISKPRTLPGSRHNLTNHKSKRESSSLISSSEFQSKKHRKVENKKVVLPSRPLSQIGHTDSIMGILSPCSMSETINNNNNKISNTSCQSMEELLEWQWDKTETISMQHTEASDIASLLSCLHDLKNENEQLVSKQHKLSRHRDHLKSMNVKLQLQLSTSVFQTMNSFFTNNSDVLTVNQFTETSDLQSNIVNIQNNFQQYQQLAFSYDNHRVQQISEDNLIINHKPLKSRHMVSSSSLDSFLLSKEVEQPGNQSTSFLEQYRFQHQGLISTTSTIPISNIISHTLSLNS